MGVSVKNQVYVGLRARCSEVTWVRVVEWKRGRKQLDKWPPPSTAPPLACCRQLYPF